MEITKPEDPKEEDLKALAAGLKAYNFSQMGEHYPQKVGTFVKSESGEVLGGAFGAINWGWLYIDWLWCSETIRHCGYGSKLIHAMEQFAISNNTLHVKLETTSFQALDFYQKLGYEVYGELNNYPVGHTTYYLKKELKV